MPDSSPQAPQVMSVKTERIPVQEMEDPNFGLPEMFTYPIDTLLDSVITFTGLDLCNDIHPVFGRSQFPGAEWEALLPALKLASRLLDTDSLPRDWYTTNFADGTAIPFPECSGWEDDEYQADFPPHETMTADDVADNKVFLRQLTMAVRFRRHGPEHFYLKGCTVPCKRQHVRAQELVIVDKFFGRQGCGSDGFYSERLYQDLLRFHRQGQGSSPEALVLHFSLAVLLVHELAHAAHYSRHGKTEDEFPLGMSTIAEAGFDWSDCVFSGEPTDSEGMVMLTEWLDL
ncbi:hypothetical protein LTR85_002816 [Meristemomyces frigidus]|nr:hypothetical protein LTR85_002816 [Meristemomyces frigidus]